jgi:CHAT domain-containing protein
VGYTAAYQQARVIFDTIIAKIRIAQDPVDFLNAPLDAVTILQAAKHIGPKHALVYLAATPWGGVAVAALSAPSGESSVGHFVTLDLPDLTEAWVNTLVETHLNDGSERIIGGFALAQMGEGSDQLKKQWDGKTFQAKGKMLQTACRKTKQESTLDHAIEEAMKCRPFARLAKRSLNSLNHEEQNLLSATLDQLFLQQELDRCLEQLGKTVIRPLIAWLREQGIMSLTLIPCGHLATFPLTAVILSDGRSVSETLPTSIAPSARALLHEIDPRKIHAGVYALGDPESNLEWSEAEALTFVALARRLLHPAEVHIKEQATRDRLLSALRNRWVVDASCHGSFDQQDFLRSALRLAKKERITMSEMLSDQANLQGLRLLLLSACQTAQLDLNGARDEVHSLAAAMLQAGAQAVLASQWAVDDKATYLLMIRFAQEWLPQMHEEPPAAALARAQAWLRTVTNAELVNWHSTMPAPSKIKSLTRASSSARQTRQTSKRRTATKWQRISVRGRNSRLTEDEAQLVVRIGAEEDNPLAKPYTNPYYWAGFQIIGW